jgi:hypothetical protein
VGSSEGCHRLLGSSFSTTHRDSNPCSQLIPFAKLDLPLTAFRVFRCPVGRVSHQNWVIGGILYNSCYLAIWIPMLNQISNDICCTNKVNLIRFDNDARTCYDRILVHLGMMAARQVRMPVKAVRIHAHTLEHMQYKVEIVV